MKTAVYFGGTFDPIHQEHIRVCDLAYNEVRPDKLMLAPAPDGLCKRAAASAEQRLQMCRIAARDRPWLEVSDIEIKQNVRYSADALFHLLEQGEYSKIWFLLGEDQFSTLPQWRGWERIVEIADILAGMENCFFRKTQPGLNTCFSRLRRGSDGLTKRLRRFPPPKSAKICWRASGRRDYPTQCLHTYWRADCIQEACWTGPLHLQYSAKPAEKTLYRDPKKENRKIFEIILDF